MDCWSDKKGEKQTKLSDVNELVSVLRTWCSLHKAHWGEKHIKQQDWSIHRGRRGKQACSRMNETEWWCLLLHYQHICFWMGSTNSQADSSQTGVEGGVWKLSCSISAGKPVPLAVFTHSTRSITVKLSDWFFQQFSSNVNVNTLQAVPAVNMQLCKCALTSFCKI